MLYSGSFRFEVVLKKRIKYIRKLLIIKKRFSGRSNNGNLIFYGRGGGFRSYYRLIDFKRLLINIPAKILQFEYDPNRNIYIMLIGYLNGVLSYLLAPNLVRCNNYIFTGNVGLPQIGSMVSLLQCTTGSSIHCVKIGSVIAKYGRSSGIFIQLIRKIGYTVLLRFPSKEERFILADNTCVLGRLSGEHVKLLKYTCAGFLRNLGYKPKVRGVAKNPVDHPHGGGEGRTTAGQPSVTPWGFYTKGSRTTTRFKRFNMNSWGFFKRRNNVVWY